MGAGAYSNALVNDGMGVPDEVPQFTSAADETGAVTVSRREYVGDVIPTTALFQNFQFAVNPGVAATFPWLSQIAANYEEYDLQQCVFTYNSTTTDIGSSTTGQCGTVVMATQYNVASPPFMDKQSMQVHDGAMSCKTTENMVHGIECDDRKRSGSDELFVRTGALAATEDVKDYDHATFNLALSNLPNAFLNQAIGELWVTYTVVLRKPKMAAGRGALTEGDLFVANTRSASGTAFGLDGDVLSAYGNSLGGSVTAGSNFVQYTFPDDFAGYVEIRLRYEGADLTGAANPITQSSGGNVSLVSDMYAAGNDTADSPANSWVTTVTAAEGNIRWCIIVRLKVQQRTSVAGFWKFTQSGDMTNWTQACLEVFQYPRLASTLSLAVGPVATRTEEPILVNRAGVVVDL